MASIIPAFAEVMQDRATRGVARDVYFWFHQNLDLVEFRFVKHSRIETELSLEDSSVARAITRLVERGYIDAGPRDGRLTSYRLFYSRSRLRAIPRQMGVVAEHA